DMGAFGTAGYKFYDHAKHWSEMKGFALGLQFSRFSPLSSTQFVNLHELLGDAPVLHTAEADAITQYRASLIQARTLLADVYDVDPANVGDDNGENGW